MDVYFLNLKRDLGYLQVLAKFSTREVSITVSVAFFVIIYLI